MEMETSLLEVEMLFLAWEILFKGHYPNDRIVYLSDNKISYRHKNNSKIIGLNNLKQN